MNELQAIVTDIRTGALPKNEIVPYVDVVIWSERDRQWINPDAPITDNKVNVIYWTENLELPRRIKA